MKMFRWPSYQDLQIYPPPCKVIEKVQYDFEEVDFEDYYDINKTVRPWFGITLFFPEPSYKEIKQAQAYDIESFVGNAGGYIGLFLGYSLMCIPNWISKMIHKAKENKMARLNKNKTTQTEGDESSNSSTENPTVCQESNKQNFGTVQRDVQSKLQKFIYSGVLNKRVVLIRVLEGRILEIN